MGVRGELPERAAAIAIREVFGVGGGPDALADAWSEHDADEAVRVFVDVRPQGEAVHLREYAGADADTWRCWSAAWAVPKHGRFWSPTAGPPEERSRAGAHPVNSAVADLRTAPVAPLERCTGRAEARAFLESHRRAS